MKTNPEENLGSIFEEQKSRLVKEINSSSLDQETKDKAIDGFDEIRTLPSWFLARECDLGYLFKWKEHRYGYDFWNEVNEAITEKEINDL